MCSCYEEFHSQIGKWVLTSFVDVANIQNSRTECQLVYCCDHQERITLLYYSAHQTLYALKMPHKLHKYTKKTENLPKSVNCASRASTPSHNALSNEELLGLHAHIYNQAYVTVGSMAQWLRCWFLAGRLSFIYA